MLFIETPFIRCLSCIFAPARQLLWLMQPSQSPFLVSVVQQRPSLFVQPSSSLLDLNDTHINVGLISILLHLKRHFSASEAYPSINEAKEEEEEKRWGAKGVGVFLPCCLCLSSSASRYISHCGIGKDMTYASSASVTCIDQIQISIKLASFLEVPPKKKKIFFTK